MPQRMTLMGLTCRLGLLLIFLVQCMILCEAQFGRKKRQLQAQLEAEALAAQEAAEEAAAAAAAEAEAEAEKLSQNVVILGNEVNKYFLYIFSCLIATLVAAYSIMEKKEPTKSEKKGNRPWAGGTVDVVLVGCGLPKKGMGWYHLTQMLEMENVNVIGVVEPFFMNSDLCKDVPASFKEFVESLCQMGIEVTKSVEELSPFTKPDKTMCLIAGRTPDNPKLFRQCIAHGASVIYLEKPGAPSVQELEEMAGIAKEKNVKVYIGYNKNVTPYVQKALKLAAETPKSQVLFCHNNSYTQSDLPEVFARNSEGMLKNMAVHELALLVTFFGVTVDNISKFAVNTNKLFSERLSIWKPGTSPPNPEYITDFSRIAFDVTTKSGTTVSVMADRCGGNVSFAAVKDKSGKEVQKFDFPDPETAAKVEEKVLADPEMMPYFFVQSGDYLELKTRVVNAALEDKDAEGVATIAIGIEALKLAEYGTEELSKALNVK